MSKEVVIDGQSIIDLALQGYGRAEAIVQLMKDNAIGAADDLIAGQVLTIDDLKAVEYRYMVALKPLKSIPDNKAERVTEGQNIIDLVIQEYGSIEALVQLVKDNSLTVDGDVSPGTILKVKRSYVVGNSVVNYLRKNGKRINSGVIIETGTVPINVRLLEDGSYRLLEDGGYRLLE